MVTDLTQVREHFHKGDIIGIAKRYRVSTVTVHNVINGRSQNLKIQRALLAKANKRKQEAEEIASLQKAL
jgi:hypothetical protein